MLGIPGDYTPPGRFIRATALAWSTVPPATAVEGANAAFHVLNAVDIPVGAVAQRVPGKAGAAPTLAYEQTQWATVHDLTNRILYFRTYGNLAIRKVDLAQARLDGQGHPPRPDAHRDGGGGRDGAGSLTSGDAPLVGDGDDPLQARRGLPEGLRRLVDGDAAGDEARQRPRPASREEPEVLDGGPEGLGAGVDRPDDDLVPLHHPVEQEAGVEGEGAAPPGDAGQEIHAVAPQVLHGGERVGGGAGGLEHDVDAPEVAGQRSGASPRRR